MSNKVEHKEEKTRKEKIEEKLGNKIEKRWTHMQKGIGERGRR